MVKRVLRVSLRALRLLVSLPMPLQSSMPILYTCHNLIYLMFQLFRACRHFTQTARQLTAHKYLRSISETALLYRPKQSRELTRQQCLEDRVVQTFFDVSSFHITVSEAAQRLKQITDHSTPCHSFYQITLPFAQNPNLKRKMIQFSNNSIRTGRLLELMDYIAANVAYRYCTPECDSDKAMDQISFIMVTAAIDSIEFYYPISVDVDCTLSGYVSFVGKSSLEVHIDVLQVIDGQQRLACSANFVMAAREKQTKKAYHLPPLNFSQEKESFRIVNQLGERRQIERKKETKKNLELVPPTYQESVAVHLLTQQLRANDGKGFVPMSSTIAKNTMIMHIEDKNLSNKVFGGLILRLCYQLAWLCSAKFLHNSYPRVTHVDDVQFLGPVEIGSYVELEAKISYVTEQYIHVIVSCCNSKIGGKKTLTNVLRITFEHVVEPEQLSQVYPQTLTDSYEYIDSMRRVKKLNTFGL